MKRAISIAVLVAAGSALPADKHPIHALPKKATKQEVRELLKGGMALSRGALEDRTGYLFGRDGRATFSTYGVPSFECARPEPYRLEGNALRFDCSLVEKGGDSSVISKKRVSFVLELEMLAPDVLVYKEDLSSLTGKQKPPERFWAVTSTKESNPQVSLSFAGAEEVRVELMPGANDRTLFDKVRNLARGVSADGKSKAEIPPAFKYAFVFEGPPARTERVRSEIFYAGDRQSESEEIAKALEPVLGRVTVRKWPGEWDYDVIVVVGTAAAQEGMPPQP